MSRGKGTGIEATLVEAEETGELTLRAPRVGRFKATVAVGHLLSPGQAVGELDILNQRLAVAVPESAPPGLRVSAVVCGRGLVAVEFGAPLLQLQAATLGADTFGATSAEAAASALGLPEHARPLRAPTDGQLYTRPAPGEPAFVNEGDLIQPGQIVGLIEVMKFFYEIRFELHGFERGARVERLVAREGHPIESGDVILYVTPVV